MTSNLHCRVPYYYHSLLKTFELYEISDGRYNLNHLTKTLIYGNPMHSSTEYPSVNSKHDFVRRYWEGEFGNGAPTWNTLADWARETNDSDNPEVLHDLERKGVLYHVRNRVAGGPTHYDVKPTELA